MKSIALNSYIDSCNGMCQRVLKDINKCSYNDKELLEAYITDINNGGRDYSQIIKLGQLLKDLDNKYRNLK